MRRDKIYLIFVEDHDLKQYAISAPVSGRYVNDWLSKITEQQNCGRSIHGQDVAVNKRMFKLGGA